MRRQAWRVQYVLAVTFCTFLVLCFYGCGTGKEESTTAVSDNFPEVENSVVDEGTDSVICEDSSGTWTEESKENVNVGEDYMDMEKDSILAMLNEDLGIDLSGYISSADGVIRGSIYYAKINVLEGAETEIGQVIVDLCGEGAKASSRKRPILNNRLAEDFKEAELLSVYDYLKGGANGAKTTSITFYTAKNEGRMCVYIFGSK